MGSEKYTIERLDHLGIVAGVCREIGLAAYLDEQAVGSQQQVSIGTATVAMVLNGLGFSNRQLYLVPQFFANKPVERLLGPGVRAAQLNDDCLGRTLDWLAAHDLTALFAGLAVRARRVFGIDRRLVHVDTTSFSVSGTYEPGEEAAIAITYGYSRDHRADLKQWLLALATTESGDVPLFLRPLDGNSADVRSLVAVVERLQAEFAASADEEASIFVADSGLYSAANMTRLQQAGVQWIARVPETSTAARTAIDLGATDWQTSADGRTHWLARSVALAQGTERWLVVRTRSGEERAQASLARQVQRDQTAWTASLRGLSRRRFACAADAEAAARQTLAPLPPWFAVQHQVSSRAHQPRRGRPAGTAQATLTWRVQATLQVLPEQVAQEAARRACFIVGTTVLDAAALPDQTLIRTYLAQGSVERGFRFLKDPLFLASSVFLKKPSRIMALAFVMVLCLLVYRLAEHRLRAQLDATHQTIPSQTSKPTARPTLRWVFQLFEGIDVLTIGSTATPQILGLSALHTRIVDLLGPVVSSYYGVPAADP
jgi:transposase